jgi:serine/threonine protein kinase
VEKFSLQDLAKVTQDFSDANVVGQGGFGKVFVATLPDGREVAIKRAPAVRQYDHAEFHNEISLLSRLHHRNLVRLEGFCDDEGLQVRHSNLHYKVPMQFETGMNLERMMPEQRSRAQVNLFWISLMRIPKTFSC